MIHLETFGPPDYPLLISWIDNAEMLMQFGGPALTFPLTPEQLKNNLSDPNRYAFKVVENSTNTTVGHGEIYSKEDGTTYLSRLLIGAENTRGKGYGTQLTHLLLAHAFDVLKQSTVFLLVFDWNKAAIHVYKKVGFTIVPGKTLLREVNGKKWTAITMSITKEEWKRQDGVQRFE
ncbi:MAG: GNAT family N-acetyltransferase [Niastella sp.]|nr:GNAT family N-acetyltransferase [Niastella sp.]